MIDVYDAPGALQTTAPSAMEAVTRGEVDMQVATAKRFPRSLDQFEKRALSMATLDAGVAEACFYSLSRGGSSITGPSVRLAEVVAQSYGNLRTGARIISEDERTITAQGVCWDMETNVLVTREVRQRITKSNGQRYGDDMITIAANAAASKAFRNAVLSVVPRAVVQRIMGECQKIAVGGGETFVVRREKWVKWYRKGRLNDRQIAALAGADRVEDIDGDGLARLIGLANSVRDGELNGEELRGMADEAIKAASMPETMDLGSDKAPVRPARPETKAKPKAELKAEPSAPVEPAHDHETGEVTEPGLDIKARVMRCHDALVNAGAKPTDWKKHLKAAIGGHDVTNHGQLDELEGYVADWCAERAVQG